MCVLGVEEYFGENYHQLTRPARITMSWNHRPLQPISFFQLSYPKCYANGLQSLGYWQMPTLSPSIVIKWLFTII